MCLEGERTGNMAPSEFQNLRWGLENTPFHWRAPGLPLCKMKLIVQDSWRIDCHPQGKRPYKVQSWCWSKWDFFFFLLPPLPLLFFFFLPAVKACFVCSPLTKKQSQMLHILSLRPLAFKYSGDNVFLISLVGNRA